MYRNFTIVGSNANTFTEVTFNFRFWAVCNWQNRFGDVYIYNYKDRSSQILWKSPYYSYNNPSQINQWDGFVYVRNITSQWTSIICDQTNPPMTSVYQNVSKTYYISNSSQNVVLYGNCVYSMCLSAFLIVWVLILW